MPLNMEKILNEEVINLNFKYEPPKACRLPKSEAGYAICKTGSGVSDECLSGQYASACGQGNYADAGCLDGPAAGACSSGGAG